MLLTLKELTQMIKKMSKINIPGRQFILFYGFASQK